MQKFKLTLIAAAFTGVLSGCASSLPRELPASSSTSPERAGKVAEVEWTEPALVKEGRPYLVLVTPMSPPADIKAKTVSLSLESGSTIKDLVSVLANLGYSIILTDDVIGAQEFYMPRYKGSLGGLMSAVSRGADVWFTWSDGVLQVSGKERIALSMPQDEALADKIKDGLTSLGATDSLVSFHAGMLTADLKPSQLKKIKSYLDRMTANAALVSLQVAIVNVTLNQNTKQGIDWSKMQAAVGKNNNYVLNSLSKEPGALNGSASLNTAGTPAVAAVAATTTTDPKTGVVTTIPAVAAVAAVAATITTTTENLNSDVATIAKNLGNTIMLSGSGLRTVSTNSLFSLIGFVDFLNSYGVTETKQNVMLKTVTGNAVKLKSVTQIPYVSGVSLATTGSSTGGAASLLGGAKTSTANDGLTLEMTPSFDAYSNTVTVKMDMSIQAVIGFNNLSAGNQVGSLSQPTTAERSFNDIIRVRPGQTVVVGGLTYDSVGDDRSAPSFLMDTRAEHKALTVNRNTMFIVIRPTITVLGAMAETENAELFPDGPSRPAVATVKAPKHIKAKKTSVKE